MTRGVTLLAIGSSAYGRWAVNFATSLKYHSPDIAIQLICDEMNLLETAQYHKLFSEITKLSLDETRNEFGDVFPAKVKTQLYKWFAFDETIYFDVDAVCIKDISPLFDLKGNFISDIQGVHEMNIGYEFDAMKWAKPLTVWEHFKMDYTHKLPAINSSFYLVRKSEIAENIFNTAFDLLMNNPLPTKQYWHKWGRGNGHQADELYMNVACALSNYLPTHANAVYFRMVNEPGEAVKLENIINSHYAIGLFGDVRTLHHSVKDYYNKLMGKIWRETYGTAFFNKCEVLLKNKIVTVRT